MSAHAIGHRPLLEAAGGKGSGVCGPALSAGADVAPAGAAGAGAAGAVPAAAAAALARAESTKNGTQAYRPKPQNPAMTDLARALATRRGVESTPFSLC